MNNNDAWTRRLCVVGGAVATGFYFDSAAAGFVALFAATWVNTAMVECAHAAQTCAMRVAYILEKKERE